MLDLVPSCSNAGSTIVLALGCARHEAGVRTACRTKVPSCAAEEQRRTCIMG
jgi:hypothetical protein